MEESAEMGSPEVYRVWRLRKQNQYIDAQIRDLGDEKAGVEISFLYNGELSYRHVCATRDAAIAEAGVKRVELEREGWICHW